MAQFVSSLLHIMQPMTSIGYFLVLSKTTLLDLLIFDSDCSTFLHFDLESFEKFIRILRSNLNKASKEVYLRFMPMVFSFFNNLSLKDLLGSGKSVIFNQVFHVKLQRLQI